jgi:ATP-dependent Clp protease ATP-binding subunit ClpC
VFERFTDKARDVVVLAQEDSRALGHNYIGTEHLLLGLLRVEDGVAAKVLSSLGVSHEQVQEQVEHVIGRGESQRAAGQIPFTPRAKKVLELALREALSIGHDYIGTEHILLGLARENAGVAARILLDCGVGSDQIRTKVIEVLGPVGIQRGRRRPRGFPRSRGTVVEMLERTQWEFRVERRDELDDEAAEWLNVLGSEGWELTAVVPHTDGHLQLVFKRQCRPARAGTGRSESA